MDTNVLVANDWKRASDNEVAFTTVQDITSPVAFRGNIRFARIQAHDGDLYIEVRKSSEKGPTANTGSIRVTQGSPLTIQTPRVSGTEDIVISIRSVTGTVNGAVIWGI